MVNAYAWYATFQAIESNRDEEKVKWLMYWVAFAAFRSIESIADIFLSFWFPLYNDIKLLFLIFLIWSPFMRGPLGSKIIYQGFIKPLLTANDGNIKQIREIAIGATGKIVDTLYS